MQIDGYTIERELGKGGMATVYLAIQESFDRKVALKVMSPALVADSTFAERFLREARIVAHLSHPHIVSVYDVGESNNNYFLAMELHTGGDLSDKIAQRIAPNEAIDILRQVAGALDYAHTNGYVHRDIKPGNVLFSQHGQAILTDFGIAKAADASTQLTQVQRVVGNTEMTKAGSIVGTPSYMSPEQARGHAVDGRADIYSLGIVLYEMLTGQVPYRAQDQIAVAIMHINEPVPVLPEAFAHFQPLVSRLLAKDPADRPQTGAELASALAELERGGGEQTAMFEDAGTVLISSEESGIREEPDQKKWGVIGGAGAALAVVALGAYFLLQSSGSDSAPVPAPEPAVVTEAATPADPATALQIARLLRDADEALEANRLSAPEGNNALSKYGEVLALDPTNREAVEGKVRVADRYIELAKAAVQERNVRSARRFVDKVAEFAPAHADLPATEVLVSRAEAKIKDGPSRGMRDELKIMGLLGSARTALAADQLTTPKGQSAYDKYQQILAIDPNHPQALEGVQRIGGRYLSLASSSAAKGNLEQADDYLGKAMLVAPGHPELAATRETVEAARAARN